MTKDVLLNPGAKMEGIEGNETPIIPDEVLMTVEEVAQYLRLKPNTVRAMARAGKLPSVKVGRGWRFRKSAIIQLLDKQNNESERR